VQNQKLKKAELTNKPSSKSDTLMWVLILVLTAAGVFANYYFGEFAWALRFAGWIVLICVLVGLASTTVKGKKIWKFSKEARMELLKVVWPKRDEVIKITMVIAALVVATSVIMWGIDSVLLWAVSWLTGRLI
jgi:preprotein translocase subunit SecE